MLILLYLFDFDKKQAKRPLRTKRMNYLKIQSTFFFLFILPAFLSGQTLIGVKGGINWSTFRNGSNSMIQSGSYTSYPSSGFGLDIKGRKSKLIHFGTSAEYYRTSVHWVTKFGPLGGSGGKDIRYNMNLLRFSVFPELMIGKRFQFFFNIGPYLSIIINSSRNGTRWMTSGSGGRQSYNTETGSANDDIHPADAGFMESLGFGYSILPFLVLSIEENGGIGIFNIDKNTDTEGIVKTKGIGVFFCVSFIIPGKKLTEQK